MTALLPEERIKCGMSKEEKDNAPWSSKRRDAVSAFNNVPPSSREAGNARKWKTFIRAEGEAVENRCIFEANVRKEQCNIAIRQAYSNEVFAGKFILDDQSCLVFKDSYDAKYRQRVSADE